MQGRLWVESEWGQSSTFHFTVTMRLAPQESALSIRDHHREAAV
jgi:light-regulated signal transduction histidine kinase (bacteriophytochrome)